MFKENNFLTKYLQNLFIKTNDLKDAKNKPIPKSEVTAILYRNMNYLKELKQFVLVKECHIKR